MTSINICAELPIMGATKPFSTRKLLAIGLVRYKFNPGRSEGEGPAVKPEEINVLGMVMIEDEVESEQSQAVAQQK